MASVIIHLAVAKVLEEKLNIKNPRDYYLGSIAPDLAKHLNRTKTESHFLYNTNNEIPKIELFTNKYKNFINNSFDLGYFIHLYTDKIWFENLIPTIKDFDLVKLLDGSKIKLEGKEITKLIYSDYTNLNISIIEEYNLDLSIFYEDFFIPNTTITEIPVERLDLLLEKMGLIIIESKKEKTYIINMELINQFIKDASEKILLYLKDTINR